MGKNISPQDTGHIYDRIAPGWYNRRHWSIFRPELTALASRWRQGKLLNLGCGHGADFLPFKDGFALYGVDISPEMLRLAQKYAAKFRFAAELTPGCVTRLPYPDGSFDWALSIACYHHLARPTEREAALRELARVLRPGGEAFITVWNRWQPAFFFRGKKIMVPWHTKEEILYRYYYLFTRGELARLIRQAGLETVPDFSVPASGAISRVFARNICLLVRKRLTNTARDNTIL